LLDGNGRCREYISKAATFLKKLFARDTPAMRLLIVSERKVGTEGKASSPVEKRRSSPKEGLSALGKHPIDRLAFVAEAFPREFTRQQLERQRR
jgi:hypothetical protein